MEPSPARPDEPWVRSTGLTLPRLGRARPVALRGVLVAVAVVLISVAPALIASSGAASVSPSRSVVAASKPSASKSGSAKHRTPQGTTIAPVSPTGTHRVTFGIAPSSATGPDGLSYFQFGVTPGGVLKDYVALVNYSKVPLSLGLSATDALETSAGGFGLLAPGVKPTDTGSWVSLPAGTTSVSVPAESSSGKPGWTVVPFSMHIPMKATPGDHVAGIVASLRTVGTNSSGQRIVLYQRVGTRVYVQVAGKLVAHLVVSDLHASYQETLNPFGEGKAVVTYRVRNAGDVDLDIDQSVSVSEVIGSDRTARGPVIALLLPGASVNERIDVPGAWPQFLLRAAVSAQGRVPVQSGLHTLRVSTSTSFWAIPWPLIVLIILVLLAWYVVRRWRRSHAQAGAGAVAEDAKGDETGTAVGDAKQKDGAKAAADATVGADVESTVQPGAARAGEESLAGGHGGGEDVGTDDDPLADDGAGALSSSAHEELGG